MRYLAASIVIAAAAAVYGLFSHGVYSYFMTYAFMIPLLGGALPHLIAAMKSGDSAAENSVYEKSACDNSEAAAEKIVYDNSEAAAEKIVYDNSEAAADKIADENSEAAVAKSIDENSADEAVKSAESAQTVRTGFTKIFDAKEAQLAVIVTLTAGSLIKGVLDIYGTTNRLLIVYPAIALLIIAVQLAKSFKSKRGQDADEYTGSDPAEHQNREIKEYA